eukprot:CAMPEP_0202482538 /NCGR_PEP_ID=MMETSP1361-20130828/1944_1 /ASSEMBLY_ACC=CAM_ASM_000849 /TAXON_ID=210615 /ORGANISM="Staurosira complex sp., Strain CCMP2646" /LENGTH=88 /DNA_ID=CAMNT_0049110473 /DNA_START=32 /DNA_END=298 /DNA_ORIENTATION=-
MGAFENLINPAYYNRQASFAYAAATNYYRPLFRSGSVKPLWHIMLGTAVIMQTATYIFKEASHISHERAIKKAALEEYKTNHPEKFHH